ncbi:hypothetical protein BSK50_10885 [Paenibacillus odorifer]|nr:hypothetical protein BSK50_10885 [Paenibacillus odorifer]
MAKSFTPCEYCSRYALCKVAALNSIRLGKLERRVLMLAPHEDWMIIDPLDTSRAADEVNRRSIRKLAKARLIYTGFQYVNNDVKQKNCNFIIKREYLKRAILIARLGESVRNYY